MQLPSNWKDVKPAGGYTPSPQPGGYILGIIKAVSEKSSKGKDMIVLYLDIVEGEFSGYYRDLSNRLTRDCLLRNYQLTEGDSLPFLKGMITAVEKSNIGYTFSGDESTLKGKKVGGVLVGDTYITKTGERKPKIKIAYLCSTQTIIDGKFKIPEIKVVTSEEPADVSPFEDDDLPF